MMDFEKPINLNNTIGSANRALEEKNALRIAQEKNMGYISVEKLNINPDFLKIITEEHASEGKIFCFFRVGKKLRIGLHDPEDAITQNIIKELKQEGYELNINIASLSSCNEAITQYKKIQKVLAKKDEQVIDGADSVDLRISINKNKPIEIVNDIFSKAIEENASDIHIEPTENKGVVRFRIDGILRTMIETDPVTLQDITTQIKHQAKIKLNVTQRPQDGRTYFVIYGKKVDVRVSTLPSNFGEDIVMRILDSEKNNLSLEQLGFQKNAFEKVQKSLHVPYGMIIATGPTGSGKTTTLYTLLQAINRATQKIITLEDPIEYHLDDITQSQINEYEGYSFAHGLRSILRQDPDVIMVGEIRDKETAEVAAQAALTGHKVLTTLHTNSAIGAISRLRNMGLPSFMIASALQLIIGQRLVRTVDREHAQETSINEKLKEYLMPEVARINRNIQENIEIPETIMSVNNELTGYKGRIGIYEVIEIDDHMREMIISEKSEHEILEYAQSHGMISMLQDGIIKTLQKQTTIEEVYRVAN